MEAQKGARPGSGHWSGIARSQGEKKWWDDVCRGSVSVEETKSHQRQEKLAMPPLVAAVRYSVRVPGRSDLALRLSGALIRYSSIPRAEGLRTHQLDAVWRAQALSYEEKRLSRKEGGLLYVDRRRGKKTRWRMLQMLHRIAVILATRQDLFWP